MKKKDIMLWENLSFVTKTYIKNSDLIIRDENIVAECEGKVSLLRLSETKLPIQVGEYSYSVWNIGLANIVDADLEKILRSFAVDGAHTELYHLYQNNEIDFDNINRMVVLESFVLHPTIRKRGVTEEFFEAIYRAYSDKHTLILGFFKPFQMNEVDDQHYFFDRTIKIRERHGDVPQKILASKYYGLEELVAQPDLEGIQYKIFSIASRCGFKRIADSHLFILEPDTILNRLLKKREKTKNNNLENELNNEF